MLSKKVKLRKLNKIIATSILMGGCLIFGANEESSARMFKNFGSNSSGAGKGATLGGFGRKSGASGGNVTGGTPQGVVLGAGKSSTIGGRGSNSSGGGNIRELLLGLVNEENGPMLKEKIIKGLGSTEGLKLLGGDKKELYLKLSDHPEDKTISTEGRGKKNTYFSYGDDVIVEIEQGPNGNMLKSKVTVRGEIKDQIDWEEEN